MTLRACIVLLGLVGVITTELQAQHFRLVTDEAGLSAATKSNGVAVADYDRDGDLDVYLVAYPQYDAAQEDTWNRLFRNNGDGTFSDMTETAGVQSRQAGFINGQMGNKFGAAWGDYDNNGFPDLFLSQIGPDLLFHNNGDGTFSDVTATARVAGSNDNSNDSSALWWDCDDDGDLDLYVSSWAGQNRMYENLGNGTFADRTVASKLGDIGQTWTSIPIDANRDGRLDLYVVNDFGANRYYVNNGHNIFTEATADYGLEDNGHGMGVAIGDVNNDGIFDIYLTNDAAYFPNPLFMGEPDGSFTEQAIAMGVSDAEWAWGTEFFDYDNDGDVDLYAVNGFPVARGKNYLFTNLLTEQGQATFEDRSAVSGANGERDARGLAVFDYDLDGKLDLLVANWNGPPYLYRNESEAGNWLLLDLVGTTSNRNAFGATVSFVVGDQAYHRHHDGTEFLGQSVAPIHVGVGEATLIDSLIVRWPNGTAEYFTQLAVNQRLSIMEGQGVSTAVEDAPLPRNALALLGSAPNPFRQSITLSFHIPNASTVELKLYNVLGQEVLSRQDYFTSSGQHSFSIEGTNLKGGGVYLYRLSVGNQILSGAMVYAK